MRMQVGRALAAVTVVGAVISGCGGPSQAGTAVFIGDQAVPLEFVQAEASAVLDRAGGADALRASGKDPAQLSRGVVTNEVLHRLVSGKAAEYGVAVTDAQIDELIAANGGAEAVLAQSGQPDLPTLRRKARDQLSLVLI
ncbi:MAG: hypothetical protein ACRDQ0_09840, partial [Pseudonocardia sp.]